MAKNKAFRGEWVVSMVWQYFVESAAIKMEMGPYYQTDHVLTEHMLTDPEISDLMDKLEDMLEATERYCKISLVTFHQERLTEIAHIDGL